MKKTSREIQDKDMNDILESLGFLEGLLKNATFSVVVEEDKKIKEAAQARIDFMRISMKYNFFDLGATDNENGFLRKMIEESDNKGSGGII